MFGDYASDVVGFESQPDKDRIVKEGSCQTSQNKSESQEVQTSTSKSVEIQTEHNISRQTPQYDVNKLASFLNRVYPQLVEELDSSDFYYPKDNETNDDDLNVSKLHVIKTKDFEGRKVSGLSWNCTGVTLAITHCEIEHENWCTSDGVINLYNTSKQDFTTLPPSTKLNTVSCVTSIAFHPWKPSVLAAGLYSGDVLVWDMRKDEDQLLSHKRKDNSDNEGHTDTVTCVVWTNDRNGPLLVSAGRDGKILFWKISFTNQAFKVYKRLFIPLEHSNSKLTDINKGLEILSINFWNNVENEFVIGVDGGNVLHCSLKAARALPYLLTFDDPVELKYNGHRSVVTSVNCRNDSKLFASCGIDGEVHVYKTREPEVLYTIYVDYPLIGVEWMEVPNVLAVWGSSQELDCYNVNSQEKLSYYTLKNEDGSVITSAKFNKQRRGIVALGDETGLVSIWHMPVNA